MFVIFLFLVQPDKTYEIQGNKEIMFHIASELQENFVAFQMNIKPKVNNFCSPFKLNFFYANNNETKSRLSIQISILDDRYNFLNIQLFIDGYIVKEFNFTDNKKLLVCQQWSNIWMAFNRNKQTMNFGIGKTLNEQSIFSYSYNFFHLKLLKIGLSNNYIQSKTSLQIYNLCGEVFRVKNSRNCQLPNTWSIHYLKDYNLDTCLTIQDTWNSIEKYYSHSNCSYGIFNSTGKVIFRFAGDLNDLISRFKVFLFLSFKSKEENIKNQFFSCPFQNIVNKADNYKYMYFNCSMNRNEIKKLTLLIFDDKENDDYTLEICFIYP